jgi:hypothetical protein
MLSASQRLVYLLIAYRVLPKKNNYRLFSVFTLCGNSRVPTGVRDTMRHYLRHHKGIAAISAFGAFLVFCWFWDLSASIRGHLDARIDVNLGRYQLLGYGLPSPSRPEYVRCLRERYKIDFRPVAECLVSESLVSYVNDYDSVLEEATRRKFGRDVFQECSDDADKKWKATSEAEARR